jgi:HPt (histidine-containing phosphotransfer) domain-containing protein
MDLVYDHSGSLRRMGNDEQLFATMVGYLQQESQRRQRDIRDAMQQGDLRAIERAAHVLKGQVSNFGATRAWHAAAQVETEARDGERAGLPESIAELAEALGELLEALTPWAPAGRGEAKAGIPR